MPEYDFAGKKPMQCKLICYDVINVLGHWQCECSTQAAIQVFWQSESVAWKFEMDGLKWIKRD